MNLTPINLDKFNTVTFTGHRPNKLAINNNGYKLEHYELFFPVLVEMLKEYLDMGFTAFITGGAQGFDQLVFWAVDVLKKKRPNILNIVYAPFINQDAFWRGDDVFGPKNYQLMLDKADIVEFCTNINPKTSVGGQVARALNYRNICMCDNASRLCSLWSWSEYEKGKLEAGGTANCVKYAGDIKLACDKFIYEFDEKERIILIDEILSRD